MSSDTDALRDIFLEVSGESTLTETQEQGPSHEPIDESTAEVEETVSVFTRDDGLDDAIDDGLGNGSGAAVG